MRSVKDENLKIPLNVRKVTNEIVLKKIKNKHNVVPSLLISAVSPSNPYLMKYISMQEKTIIIVSITRMAVLERTLLDK
ncbi:MAG: hypothetical protein PHV89_10230 [Fermentimonas sp.]|jgi:hypothetical protein|nr:hypothetical protein [Fermentimonas sp.]MDD2931711.1 hypothetical protein [Fermentimonas sp.]MDD3510823.1 hypothetical protein [Fermentimonas sp.]MDD4284627.1 hypothetical protein [Fermentimonas sp.]MDD4725138.1 hypothetical protein [Fermentimonas sp.]